MTHMKRPIGTAIGYALIAIALASIYSIWRWDIVSYGRSLAKRAKSETVSRPRIDKGELYLYLGSWGLRIGDGKKVEAPKKILAGKPVTLVFSIRKETPLKVKLLYVSVSFPLTVEVSSEMMNGLVWQKTSGSDINEYCFPVHQFSSEGKEIPLPGLVVTFGSPGPCKMNYYISLDGYQKIADSCAFEVQ